MSSENEKAREEKPVDNTPAELSDESLENVAGGGLPTIENTTVCCYWGNTIGGEPDFPA